MSEFAPKNPEQTSAETSRTAEHQPKAEQQREIIAEQSPSLEHIRRSINQEAAHQEHTRAVHETKHTTSETAQKPSSALKQLMRERTLTRVRRDLSAPERTFSKIIHRPLVDVVSDTIGKTVVRPSGVLSGGICALLGSVVAVYVTKHYGYRYNYLLFLAFFVSGFLIGLIIELIVFALRRSKQGAE